METYTASFYNLRVAHHGSTLLFNGKTGALLRLDSPLMDALRPLLGPERTREAGVGYSTWLPAPFSASDVPPMVADSWKDLLDAGVFVPTTADEREVLRTEYVYGRSAGPLHVTVTTTLNCNMRCYYCYQKDEELDHMSPETADAVTSWVKERIATGKHDRLYIEWYGGEPMLNRDVIERLSADLGGYCDERGLVYKSSMLCNGTNWPDDVEGFLERARLYRVQFSVDGPERFHNKRRGTIDPKQAVARKASFAEVMDTVGKVLGHTDIYFRINVDPWVGQNCLELIDVFAENGWLCQERFYPYVAIINAMTEHCGFIAIADQFKDFSKEFDSIQKEFYRRLSQHRGPKALERAMYYPTRKLVNCGAVSDNAVVFGPNGLMYKCGLDVGDNFRSHGATGSGLEILNGLATRLDADRWDRYDPFTHDRCKECQYLPVCFGGCPKAQIERDEAHVRSTSAFFEEHFDRMIHEYYDAAERA